jgi:pyruvate formate lyase activating enzyme
MVIGGFQKTSLSDFPGVISSIVFTRGCGFRCPYCHNPELVEPSRFAAVIPWSEVKAFLQTRAGRIEGVVVTGGEPTCHSDLPDFLAELQEMGLRVKLDTNGTNPAQLRRILSDGLVDFIAMDVKAPLLRYAQVAGVPVHTEDIRASLQLVRESGVPHELRTTFAPAVLSMEELRSMAELVRGCQRFVIQAFRADKTLDPALVHAPSPSEPELKAAAAWFTAAGITVEIR